MVAATESHGLLEVEVETPPTSHPQDHHYHGHGPAPSVRLGLLILLASFISGAVFIVFRSSGNHGPLMAESQIALLNALAERESTKTEMAKTCESTLLLMRHCEKRGKETSDLMGNQHCSDIGLERAAYIRTLFGSGERWALPSKLYALSRGRPGVSHLNYREIETLEPLKNKAGVDIDTRFTEGTERGLARDYFGLLTRGEFCGKTTVVNWKHSRIPTMATALGCGHDQGCPRKYHKKEFDKMWQLKYSYRGRTDSDSGSDSEEGRWTVSGSVVSEGFQPQK
mmetsp:Transcript_32961/g.72297  ORF Transcript_32961/g.72297 Transcript_32961/m.72297 type:complete len:283 (+) Transcript_32961:148-996(+)